MLEEQIALKALPKIAASPERSGGLIEAWAMVLMDRSSRERLGINVGDRVVVSYRKAHVTAAVQLQYKEHVGKGKATVNNKLLADLGLSGNVTESGKWVNSRVPTLKIRKKVSDDPEPEIDRSRVPRIMALMNALNRR